MKAPQFWRVQKSLIATALWPASLVWRLGAWLRGVTHKQQALPLPCIVVGNMVVGGGGKTPVVQALAQHLQGMGKQVAIVSRGYKGALACAGVRVDAKIHTATDVGDEPLLHAAIAPTYVAANRMVALRMAQADGADIAVVDDGARNPALQKAAAVYVFGGAAALGNGLVFPAGPLRETMARAKKRMRAAIIFGPDEHGLTPQLGTMPVFTGMRTTSVPNKHKPVVAFAGLAGPEGFFSSLRDAGVQVVDTVAFADHYQYTQVDIQRLSALAQMHGAQLVATAKDHVRLPSNWAADVQRADLHTTINNIENLVGVLLDE